MALCLTAFGWLSIQAETNRETLIDPRIIAVQTRSSDILNAVPQTEGTMRVPRSAAWPADLSVSAEISDAYAAAFLRYYTDSQTNQAVMTCFRLTTQTLEEKVMNEIAQYTDRNLPVVLMTVFDPAQPIEGQNPNLTEVAVALITRIGEWLHLYYPQYNTPQP